MVVDRDETGKPKSANALSRRVCQESQRLLEVAIWALDYQGSRDGKLAASRRTLGCTPLNPGE
jgi:hypothetical protein